MTATWAIRFDVTDGASADAVTSLGRLRLLAGVQACRVSESRLWVIGANLDDDLLLLLRGLSCDGRFRIGAGSTLTKFDEQTPSGVLPEGSWQPVSEFIQPELPVAGLSLARIPRVSVTLVRSSAPVEPQFLLASGEAALEWAASAPQIRLDCLSFAASDDGRVLFRGSPLPSIPGARLFERDRVLIPVGWTWSPFIEAKSLRTSLEASAEQLVLLNQDGGLEKIPESEFVAASRSAIRVSTIQKATP
jgi:hypothetical protein